MRLTDEAESEIDVLKLVYGEQVQIEDFPSFRRIVFPISPQTSCDGSLCFIHVTVLIDIMEDYPTSLPLIDLCLTRGLGDLRNHALKNALKAYAGQMLQEMMLSLLLLCQKAEELFEEMNLPEGKTTAWRL